MVLQKILSIFKAKSFLFPFVLWLVFFSWRPWVVGFYYDDWGVITEGIEAGAPFSWERFAWFLNLTVDRPMAGVTHFLITSTIGASTLLWHILISLIFLLFLWIYHRFLKELFRLLALPEDSLAITLTTALWACLPWIFGWSLWVCTTGFIFMCLFAFCGERLLYSWNRGKNPGFLPAVTFLVLCFYYEQFYLQFFFFFLFVYFSGRLKPFWTRQIVVPLLSLSLVQMIALLWNRTHSHRGISPQWMEIFTTSLVKLPSRFINSAASFKILVLIAFIAFVPLVAKSFYAWHQKHKGDSLYKKLLWFIAVSMAGVVLSVAFYSAGGYPIATIGTSSRTSVGLSFWLLTTFSLVLYVMFSVRLAPLLNAARTTVLILLFLGLGLGNIQRTLQWSKAWRISQDILDAAPAQVLSKISKDAVILYSGPYRYKEVQFFGSTWAISGALHNRYPFLRVARSNANEHAKNGWHPVLLCPRAPVSWDGKTLRQTVSKQLITISTQEVWLWDTYKQQMKKLEAPMTIQCPLPSFF